MASDSSKIPSPQVAKLTCGAQLAWAVELLIAARVPRPESDALLLLAHVIRAPAPLLREQPDQPITAGDAIHYAELAHQRASGDALAYLTGQQAFMGLDLWTDRRAPLVRPSAESLVEVALACLRCRPADERDLLMAELGTGCGAISLALGLLEPRLIHIYAAEGSAQALAVARANGERYLLNVVISWVQGETLESIPEPVDLIVGDQLGDISSPRFARLIEQAPMKLRRGGLLIIASGSSFGAGAWAAIGRLLNEALPGARVSFASSSEAQPDGDSVVVVAQLPP